MRKLRVCFSFVFVAVVAMGLAACGNDDSDFSSHPDQRPDEVLAPIDDQSDSTADSLTEDEPENRLNEKENAGKNSSSSKKTSSSSSGKESVSGSSESKSSDSGKDKGSSSSESSSSAVSSSSMPSSSSRGKDGSLYDAANNTLTDYRDGQIYRTVTIGEQIWMAENLNYAYTDVSFAFADFSSDSTSWCYENDSVNCTKYGRLYLWAAAMDSVGVWSTSGKGCGYTSTCSPAYPVRGICPEGWHLPTSAEFGTLFSTVGNQLTAAEILKSTSGWLYRGGTDAYAFSALPAGWRLYDAEFVREGDGAVFWCSNEDDATSACFVGLYGDGDSERLDYDLKITGCSVRCLKD